MARAGSRSACAVRVAGQPDCRRHPGARRHARRRRRHRDRWPGRDADARPHRVACAPGPRRHEALRDLDRLPIEEQMLITVRTRGPCSMGLHERVLRRLAKPRLDVVLRREIEAGREAGPGFSPMAPRSPSPAGWATPIRCTCPMTRSRLLVGRGRRRRDPARVPGAGARGRGPLEAEPLGRLGTSSLLRADPDDGRARWRPPRRWRAAGLARRRPLPQRGVGDARVAPRHRGDLPRQLRRRARPGRARGRAGPGVRRARAGHHP